MNRGRTRFLIKALIVVVGLSPVFLIYAIGFYEALSLYKTKISIDDTDIYVYKCKDIEKIGINTYIIKYGTYLIKIVCDDGILIITSGEFIDKVDRNTAIRIFPNEMYIGKNMHSYAK